MKVAIVHEMLVKLGWAEKVVEVMREMFPEADIFTLIYDESQVSEVFPRDIIHPQVFALKTQRLYNILKKQRLCLPFMAAAIESLDLSAYDVVLVSSSWFAHGIITKPDTKVIVYSHSPARYLWDWTNEYKSDISASSWVKWYILNKLFLKLRQWDFMAGQRADVVIANSKNTASRIKKYHRRAAGVLYPPVEVERFSTWKIQQGDSYIIISALTPFKKIEVAIEAFNKMPDKKLKIIWSGDHGKNLKSISQGNIEFSWRLWWNDLVEAVNSSLGLIFPGEEDFWIVPVEVMAAGKPVFALAKGGLLETVIPKKTGEFFFHSDGWDFIENFEKFHKNNLSGTYNSQDCVKQAQKFDKKTFQDTLSTYIYDK